MADLDPGAGDRDAIATPSMASPRITVHLDRLARRFGEAWVATGAAPRPALLDQVLAAYGEPGRHYHDLEHLEEALGVLDALACLQRRPAEAMVALLFHDAIYDPRATDNEAASAAWAARSLGEAGASVETVDRVDRWIRATQGHEATAGDDPDLDALLDADLAILGASPERFERFEADIRREYAFVPEAAYETGRSAVLRAFLERSDLYRTRPLRRSRERAARANLRRALDALVGAR